MTVTLRAPNPYDFTPEELAEAAALIRDAAPSLDVNVLDHTENGYGVDAGETLDLLVNSAAPAVMGVAVQAAVDWMRGRLRRERDEHPELPPRQRTVPVLHGPNGEVLSRVTVDDDETEPQSLLSFRT
ncbi:hypothetical protein SAMN05216499_1572 [Actinacidiphila paucisporea]|uniref:Uncharacterized protein n=1 Tax=Actinacidiphila paucisporea TaxID=310782 RepID=A0A1M7QZV7_9ACTN|nr:hypothetical protein SAMN05216499_1572 [Actinacidiphila paucisporea]